MFSIIIPTWNNISFLKLCIAGIRKNSAFRHQILVHVNEGADGSLDWVREEGLEYTASETNIGICRAVNLAAARSEMNYIVYLNDDMYVLPGWDQVLAEEISRLPTDCFMLSSTMIEPYYTRNPCVIVADFGRDASGFREEELLSEFRSLKMDDWSGSTWPPVLVHRTWWETVGGLSEAFSPGMSSDDDFSMKMWMQGCRIFKGVAASRVYHFVSKSTGRVKRNNGRKQFLQKWSIKQSVFHRYYLHRGEAYRGPLADPKPDWKFVSQKWMSRLQKHFS
jgi:GT2 family glycosyltransferase